MKYTIEKADNGWVLTFEHVSVLTHHNQPMCEVFIDMEQLLLRLEELLA